MDFHTLLSRADARGSTSFTICDAYRYFVRHSY